MRTIVVYQLAENRRYFRWLPTVYRPEWIAKWEAGQAVEEIARMSTLAAPLWQALYQHTLALGSPFIAPTSIKTLFNALQASSATFEQLPERLFVFGISSLPPRYLDALKALGEHIDVHLMFTNPCRYYWGDVRDRKFLARLAAKHRQHLVWQQDHSQALGESGS